MYPTTERYQEDLFAEAHKWGRHLAVEATGEPQGWVDHPTIHAHYAARGEIEGFNWRRWVVRHFGGPARRSLELGCGSGSLSLQLFSAGSTIEVEGLDLSPDRVAKAEQSRVAANAPGLFWVEDANRVHLHSARYDLIASSHSFHHFLELEHVMTQVVEALTPRGLFVLEEYVGPTQFQWTDEQMKVTDALLALLPERYRRLPWGAIKKEEGRPTAEAVAAGSPFESIRSSEIVPLFERYFEVVHRRNLGGTIQHLLYNGILQNFRTDDPEADHCIRAIFEAEDGLIDSGLLPSDFQLLIGRRP